MAEWQLQELLEYFGQEQACYTQLLDLSQRQRHSIEANDVDELLRILSQKQNVLERVGAIERSLLPYKQNWQRLRGELEESARQVLDVALATVEELLNDLIAAEKESERLLVARRDACRNELNAAAAGSAAHQAYASRPGGKPARFIDVRSD